MNADTDTLYAARDVARIFGLTESRVLYWARTGVVGPSAKRGGKQLFTFQDLISVKAAKELLDRGVSLQAVRKNLAALRSALPHVDRPLQRLRVVSDGERLVVASGDAAFEALSGQLVMDFAVGALSSQVADVMELPTSGTAPESGPARPAERTAYDWFLDGCAVDGDDPDGAAAAYQRALEMDPALAAAHVNLGNLSHRSGIRDAALEHYQRALALDPDLPEGRYNLGNLLDELGDAEGAITEWTRALALSPDLADAHFNLGVALLRAGSALAGRLHLARYLLLAETGANGAGGWTERARALLEDAPA